MGEFVKMRSSDGHTLSGYVAKPVGDPIAGLVVVQEIFGVNEHIRSVADEFAEDGFFVVAPALFDRIQPGIDLTYEGDDLKLAMVYRGKLELDKAVIDVEAAIAHAEQATGKKVGVIGYCFGGLVAWLSATRLSPGAAVGYYAGGIGKFAAEKAKAPVQLHFGELDRHIPAEQVDAVRAANPEVEINWYQGAGHAFNCDLRDSYHPHCATLARGRAMAFLKKHLA
jgi:carboxymethylenebutenolidase